MKVQLPQAKTPVCNRNKTHILSPFRSRLLQVAPDLSISAYTPPHCSELSHVAPDSSTLLHLALLLLHLALKSSTNPKLTDIRFFKARAQHTSWGHVRHTPTLLRHAPTCSDVPALHLALEFQPISVFLTMRGFVWAFSLTKMRSKFVHVIWRCSFFRHQIS